MKYRAILWWLWVSCLTGWAAEKLPPKPANYFNDYAAIISPGTVQALNHQLADFERQTSSQLIVAIYPTLQTDSAMEDYTVQILRSWGIGQKDKNNGAVLFIFVKEHKMRIETGYGLEGALPDAICKRIIEDEIAPHFKQQDFNGGVTAGVTAMMAAAKGEYRETGRTVNDAEDGAGKRIPRSFIRIAVFLFILLILFSRSRGSGLGGFLAGWMIGGGGGGGGGWSGGGGGGGGDGFSGGGGGGGGGGASGGW